MPAFVGWADGDRGSLRDPFDDRGQRARSEHLDVPYPGGESWRQAVARVGRFLGDLPLRWEGQRVLLIGHVATRWGLDHFIGGAALEALAGQDFAWREGWEYLLR
jgi:2,3-bisphosphoglycerate-dependent phosphoglycerate mutase